MGLGYMLHLFIFGVYLNIGHFFPSKYLSKNLGIINFILAPVCIYIIFFFHYNSIDSQSCRWIACI